MANLFKSVSIRGYRRLHSVDIEMRNLMVLIGANGVGKTSLLDIFSLLSASATGKLSSVVGGRLNEMLTRRQATSFSVRLSINVDDHASLDYYLELTPQGQTYSISNETLTQKNDQNAKQPFKHFESSDTHVRYFDDSKRKLMPVDWDHNYLETSLSQVPKMYKEPENLRKILASCTYYGSLSVAKKSPVRLPQEMRPATLPGADGEDLVSCLYYLRETDKDRFELLEDTLSAAFPDFEGLSFPPVAAGILSMTWKDKNFIGPLYMHELSEGTLRFLWLTALLQSKNLSAITLLDEPEVSLHPELLKLLAHLMRDAAQRTQLLVATHSDRLIRFLKPSEVLVCDAEDGLSTMKWADSFDLEKWLDEYSLDEVWSMNIIGGQS
jgi:predicted ATPase